MDTKLSLSEIEGKIAEADGALRKIGAVNMLAIEEYEKVQRQVDGTDGAKGNPVP